MAMRLFQIIFEANLLSSLSRLKRLTDFLYKVVFRAYHFKFLVFFILLFGVIGKKLFLVSTKVKKE